MPNNVTHRLVFAAEHAEAVSRALLDAEGRIDFGQLIPPPAHMYQAGLTAEDEKDFPCNWYAWQREHWGTKWNGYNAKVSSDGDGLWSLWFETAWSVPYPVIVALANTVKEPFTHKYFDEGHNFWGVETWGVLDGCARRLLKRRSAEEDRRPLCIEIKGYDPDAEDVEVVTAVAAQGVQP